MENPKLTLSKYKNQLLPFIAKAMLVVKFVGESSIYYPVPGYTPQRYPLWSLAKNGLKIAYITDLGDDKHINSETPPEHIRLLLEFANGTGKYVRFMSYNDGKADWHIHTGTGHDLLAIMYMDKLYAELRLPRYSGNYEFSTASWAIPGEWTKVVEALYQTLVNKGTNVEEQLAAQESETCENIVAGKGELSQFGSALWR